MGFVLNTDFSTIAPDEGGNARRNFPVSDSRGWLVQIVSSEGKETSKKDGTLLDMVLTGLEGAVQGKSADWSINVANPNQKAVEIGMGQLSAVAHVTGHVRVGNSAEWHNKPFRVVVEVDSKADLEKYPNSTRITKILDVNGNSASKAGQGVMGAAQGQQAAAFTGQGQPTSQQSGGTGSPAQQSGGGSWNGGGAQNQAAGFDPNVQQAQQFNPNAQQGQQQQTGQQFQGGNFQQNAGGATGPGWNQ